MIEVSPPEPPRLATIVNSVAKTSKEVLSPGDIAALRRLRSNDPSCSAFWRLAATQLAPVLPEGGPARDEAERRWAVILQAMAEMTGLHAPGRFLGRALASAGIAEQRVLRLLRADGEGLCDAVRVTSHFLASTATPADHVEIARLVLSDGRDDEEPVRRRIAREYYAQQQREETLA